MALPVSPSNVHLWLIDGTSPAQLVITWRLDPADSTINAWSWSAVSDGGPPTGISFTQVSTDAAVRAITFDIGIGWDSRFQFYLRASNPDGFSYSPLLTAKLISLAGDPFLAPHPPSYADIRAAVAGTYDGLFSNILYQAEAREYLDFTGTQYPSVTRSAELVTDRTVLLERYGTVTYLGQDWGVGGVEAIMVAGQFIGWKYQLVASTDLTPQT